MKNKGFLFALFFALLSFSPVAALAATTNSVLYSAKLNPDVTVLNERSGPGTSYDRVGQLSAGTTISVYAESKGWVRISTAQKWVQAQYVTKLVKTAAASESTPAVKTASATNSVLYSAKLNPDVTVLNERSGPGASYAKVGQLSGGATISVYAESKGWVRISTAQKWVQAQYVTKLVKTAAAVKPAVHISSVPVAVAASAPVVADTSSDSDPFAASSGADGSQTSATVDVNAVGAEAGTVPTPAYLAAIKKANAYCRSVAGGCNSWNKSPKCVAANQECEAEQEAAFSLLKLK